MSVETGSYISDFNTSLPAGGDGKNEGDNHIRLVKSWIKATFANITGAITATHTEINRLVGVTSGVQSQLDAKAPLASPALTGTASAQTLNVTTALNVSGPTALSSTASAVTPGAGSNSTSIATTEFVQTAIAGATGGASRAEMFFYGSF